MNAEGASLKVLLVEDNETVRAITIDLLEELGHQVCAVADAESGLVALAERAFDAVMTDISLPGMSGLALARAVAVRFPQLPVVISSGYESLSEATLQRELQLQVVVLVKPYEFESLRRALAEATRDRAP